MKAIKKEGRKAGWKEISTCWLPVVVARLLDTSFL